MLLSDQDYPRAYGQGDDILYIIPHPGGHPICVDMFPRYGGLTPWWFYSICQTEEQIVSVRHHTRRTLSAAQLAQFQSFDLSKLHGESFAINRHY